jgi:SAM-dependent methyltransferase
MKLTISGVIVKKFYQTDWFNIQFNMFTRMRSSKLADQKFYDEFYDEFHKNYNSYDDLPETWKNHKKILINYIFDAIQDKKKVLSIGCGIGYIEDQLSKSQWSGNLTAIEPSIKASKWLKANMSITLIHGYFPIALEKISPFDLAYISYVDYVFDNDMYIQFLTSVKNYPINDFLLIGASVYNPTLNVRFKDIIKSILSAFGFFNQQFWGYQRTIQEHLHLFEQVGFKNIDFGKLENDIYWIRAKND